MNQQSDSAEWLLLLGLMFLVLSVALMVTERRQRRAPRTSRPTERELLEIDGFYEDGPRDAA